MHAGLWVGSVVLTNVSRPASLPADALEPTASEFQFRLLVHVDAEGNARLLQKVLQMWQNGTYKTDPADPTKQVLDEPGRYVLVTDDSLIPRFSGAALRDGQPVARRYSTVAFSFQEPLALAGTGQFGGADGVFTCQVVLPYNDPRNPFVHQYHPDHDNLDERFQSMVPKAGPAGLETTESWTVTRDLRLQFTATDPQALGQPGWGDNQVGGLYEETIRGLHSHDLTVSGVFRLQRASSVPVLNDGL